MVNTESVFSSEKMKGISHAIQEVAPGETGVVILNYTYTYTEKEKQNDCTYNDG